MPLGPRTYFVPCARCERHPGTLSGGRWQSVEAAYSKAGWSTQSHPRYFTTWKLLLDPHPANWQARTNIMTSLPRKPHLNRTRLNSSLPSNGRCPTCDWLRFIFRFGDSSLSTSFWSVLQPSNEERSNTSLIVEVTELSRGFRNKSS